MNSGIFFCQWVLPTLLIIAGIYMFIYPINKDGDEGFGKASVQITITHFIAGCILWGFAGGLSSGIMSYKDLKNAFALAQGKNKDLKNAFALAQGKNKDLKNALTLAQEKNKDLKNALTLAQNRLTPREREMEKLLAIMGSPYSLLHETADGSISLTQTKSLTQTNSLGMKFVYIPSGNFIMGSPKSEEGRYNDEIKHKVTLTKGFYMQTTEVTQGQWQEVMGYNPSGFKNCGDNCPVENVSWDDAQEFIKKLNRKEKGAQYRLPTEAEWEYACRAGTETRYYTGDSEADLDRAGWYDDNSGGKTHPVGRKKPNGFGLYDMHGNVWEWCSDWYGDYPSGSVTDPQGPLSGDYRVLRGGSWFNGGRSVRSAHRFRLEPAARYDLYGLRLARGQTSR
jgi:formylglycine-generating enzyme required for sulfatase activity